MANATDLNLQMHREPVSVWNRRGWDGTRQQLTLTRWLIGVGGAALAIQGARQRSLTGTLLAGMGGSLAWWALTGEGDVPDVRQWVTSIADRAGWTRDDFVHEASADSFPASDAPSFTPTVGTGLRNRRAVPRPAAG